LQDLEENYPKIVAGLERKSLDNVALLYSRVVRRGVIRMSSLEAAEAEKLFEGIYRDVNIALANQLASFCEKAGLDYWEIMNAANSQPYCDLHRPGSGVGGACIPVYPVFISNMADDMGINLSIVKVAREENESQPREVAESAIKFSSASKGDKIAILGLAFRGDVSDDRLSPTYSIASYLKEEGFNVWVHDPICKPSKTTNDFTFTPNLKESTGLGRLVASSLKSLTIGARSSVEKRTVFAFKGLFLTIHPHFVFNVLLTSDPCTCNTSNLRFSLLTKHPEVHNSHGTNLR
jgi:nucleotide sugar dehydrogenase